MAKKCIIGGVLFLIALSTIVFIGVEHLRSNEEYEALRGRMLGIQKALNAYSIDHGGGASKFVLPSTLNDLFDANYLSKSDFWFYIDRGQLEYRGSIEGANVGTPLVRGTTKSGSYYWCAIEGPVKQGEGW